MPIAPGLQQPVTDRQVAIPLPTLGGFLISAITRPPSGRGWRRVLGGVFLLAFLVPLQWINQLFLWLDILLFPGFGRVPVERPLFIVGPPRSGTTLMHRLLATDSEQFTTFPLWEILFAPAICQKHFFLFLYRLDGWIGHPLFALLGWMERVMLRGSDGIHDTSLQLPEEDFLLFLPRRACFLLILAFPYCEGLWRLGYFDKTYPVSVRRRLLRYYRGLVQRHLAVRGVQRRFLSKNASFSSWVESLGAAFPDARFIGLLRRPDETVPSQLSSIRDGLRAFGNDVRDPRLVGRFVDLMAFYHGHVARTLSRLPPSQARIVRYVDLRDRPDETVLRARSQLGYPVSENGRRRLDEAVERARCYRSGHRYALSDFDLNETDIRQRFAGPAMDLLAEPPEPSPRPRAASTDKYHDNTITPVA